MGTVSSSVIGATEEKYVKRYGFSSFATWSDKKDLL